MFHRFLIACAVLVLGVTAASAQSCQEPIDKRLAFMKHSSEMARTGSAMVKGDIPFDMAKVKEIFAAFAADAGAMPTLFPECSKTGEHTTAASTIWDKPDDFKAAIARFSADIKAAQDNVKDVDSLKASFQAIGKDCGSCHQMFRMRSG